MLWKKDTKDEKMEEEEHKGEEYKMHF